ncbi:MAG: HAD family hydrolase [Phycisphaerae bacterium]|nr:HAD family hydrolase [Phycisphaerae bacterium]
METTTRQISGVLFDLGDTLLRFGKVDTRGLFEQGAELAYAYLRSLGKPVPDFARFHRRQLRAVRWNVLVSRLTRREFNALDVLTRQSRRMDHDLTDAEAAELAWKWYKPLRDRGAVAPGTFEALRRLRDDGLTLGLVSNTFIPGQVLDRHLAEEGLLELLPIRVYSCDVRYRKPHPKIFAIGCERTALAPQQALFVGDSLRADIYGANRAGLVSVLLDPDDEHADPRWRPRHRIAALSELPDVVAAYAGCETKQEDR